MNSVTELLKAIAEILKAIAWPIAIPVGIYFILKQYKEKIDELLGKVFSISAKIKGAELTLVMNEVEEKAKVVEEKAKVVEVDMPAVVEGSEVESELSFVSLVNDGRVTHTKQYKLLLEVARFSPRAAVIGAWSEVQSVVDSLAKAAKKLGMKHPLGDAVAFGILEEMEIVSTDMAELYDKLRGVWVKANSDSDSDFAMKEYDTKRYLSVTLLLVARLIELKEKIRRS